MKGFKKYPENFKDINKLLWFIKDIRKYRYFCKYQYTKKGASLWLKKQKRFCKTYSKVWQRKNYGDNFIHYFSGIYNTLDFPQHSKSIYDYSWEWNMFCIKDEEGIWNLRFTYYDITFGTQRKFNSKKEIVLYTKSLRNKNSYGLWTLKEYTDFIILN
jgi:hypothetical protein